MSILRFLYQTLCAFLQIKDTKHIEQNFHSVAGVMPQRLDCSCFTKRKSVTMLDFDHVNLYFRIVTSFFIQSVISV